MGWGSLLIPGGNDGLILVGMPLDGPSLAGVRDHVRDDRDGADRGACHGSARGGA